MAWSSRRPEVINRVVALPVESIHPNPNQPRRQFDPNGIEELAHSIAANGLLQPISVRPQKDGYELISGERRLLAYQSLGQQTIPAIVLELPTQDSAVLALVENLHRADLSFWEEAQAIAALMENLNLTQQTAAAAPACHGLPNFAAGGADRTPCPGAAGSFFRGGDVCRCPAHGRPSPECGPGRSLCAKPDRQTQTGRRNHLCGTGCASAV